MNSAFDSANGLARLSDAATRIAPAALNKLYEHASDVLLNAHAPALDRLFALEGALGDLGECRAPGVHYNVPLLDARGQATLLHIPAGLLADCEKGSAVKLVGRVRRNIFKQAVQFRLDVLELERMDASLPAKATGGLTAERLRALRSDRYPFPFTTKKLRIDVICGRENSVFEDFERELKPVASACELSMQEVAVTDASAVAAAIERAEGEVIVLIRGGGDGSDMSVFDSLPVLEAMSRKACFRLIGIGHSKDRHLLDRVVDFATSTPGTAGRFVRDQIEARASFVERERRDARSQATKRVQQLEEAHGRTVRAAELKLQQIRDQLSHADELLRTQLSRPSIEHVQLDQLDAMVRNLKWQRGVLLAFCAMLFIALMSVLLQPLPMSRIGGSAQDPAAPPPASAAAFAIQAHPEKTHSAAAQRKQSPGRNGAASPRNAIASD